MTPLKTNRSLFKITFVSVDEDKVDDSSSPKDPKAAAGSNAAETKNNREKRDTVTNPPESVFKKLEPNKNRYSLLNKDEL